MDVKSLKLGGILLALAVITGAFGAHALRDLLDEKSLQLWETANRYHFYHSFGIIVFSLLKGRGLKWTPVLFLSGIICFSGSLYLMACRDLIDLPLAWLGPVTPLGGLFFILAWLSFLRVSDNPVG